MVPLIGGDPSQLVLSGPMLVALPDCCGGGRCLVLLAVLPAAGAGLSLLRGWNIGG